MVAGAPLKSLAEHNVERLRTLKIREPVERDYNGIACPLCGHELYDCDSGIVLPSDPPQTNVHCGWCGWTGSRLM